MITQAKQIAIEREKQLCDRCRPFNRCAGLSAVSDADWELFSDMVSEGAVTIELVDWLCTKYVLVEEQLLLDAYITTR